jgi:AcrR family transcriptional regulator
MQHPFMRRGMTGRAVSASIHSRLHEALVRGEPMTYAQLADHAGCTVRSVRNYLARSQEIFGFAVETLRDPDNNSIKVRAKVAAPRPDQPPDHSAWLAAAVRERLFRLEPGARPQSERLPLLAAFRGIPAYGQEHEKLLGWWLAACRTQPRLAVRLRPRSSTAPDTVLWPVGAVLHNIEGLLLVGLPVEADAAESVRVINLDAVSTEADALVAVGTEETGEPAVDLAAIDMAELLDVPFSVHPRVDEVRPSAKVHVRFEPELAERMGGRVVHRTQSAVLRTDGSLDVKFGPADLSTAAAWARSFGKALRVLGSKKLRKAVKKGSYTP